MSILTTLASLARRPGFDRYRGRPTSRWPLRGPSLALRARINRFLTGAALMKTAGTGPGRYIAGRMPALPAAGTGAGRCINTSGIPMNRDRLGPDGT